MQDMRNLRKKRCALTPRFRKYNLVNGLFSRLPCLQPLTLSRPDVSLRFVRPTAGLSPLRQKDSFPWPFSRSAWSALSGVWNAGNEHPPCSSQIDPHRVESDSSNSFEAEAPQAAIRQPVIVIWPCTHEGVQNGKDLHESVIGSVGYPEPPSRPPAAPCSPLRASVILDPLRGSA